MAGPVARVLWSQSFQTDSRHEAFVTVWVAVGLLNFTRLAISEERLTVVEPGDVVVRGPYTAGQRQDIILEDHLVGRRYQLH